MVRVMMRNRNGRLRLIGRCSVTFIHVCFTQAALYLVSSMFVSSSLLTLISLAVVVLLTMAGIGRCCKVVGMRSSAPAFVFMNLIFVWCVYIFEIRRAISSLQDIIFNLGVLMLAIGLYSIMSSDPGFIKHGSGCNNNTVSIPFLDVEVYSERVRYCKYCKTHIKGFDHHCPAFGNCIGHGNYRLFIVLVVFITMEASYIACVSQSETGINKIVVLGNDSPYSFFRAQLCPRLPKECINLENDARNLYLWISWCDRPLVSSLGNLQVHV